MAQKIVRLSEEVVNKIAAGEVVENPASIAKELIENSLDAGAKRIEIVIEKGGHHLLCVEDDGCGMSREDALLSLERHATSKIRSIEDLEAIATLGFRGEALAAIAAVSLFDLRTSEGGEGVRLTGEGGRLLSAEPFARNRGTTISIRSLFDNVPARKKFQKSPQVSAAQVARTVKTLALASPDVAFSLTSNGERLLSLDPQQKRERIETLLGPFQEEIANSEAIWGLLAAPEEAKAQRRGQYLFVNGRAVFSPLAARAVQAGYGNRLAKGLFPPFLLFLTLSPEEVDVNAHPQKREVRFCDEKKVFRLIEETIASSFAPPRSFSHSLSFSPPPFSLAEEEPSPPLPEKPLSLLPLSERPLFSFRHFLFLERGELLLVDLQRAEARLLFDSLTERKGTLQPLLWPLEIALDDEALEGDLTSMGIECRRIGKKTLAIDALPLPLEVARLPHFLAAWKAGRDLRKTASLFPRKKTYLLEEGVALWRELRTCRDSQSDPLGRPIWRAIEEEDLKRFFEASSDE